MLLRCGETSIQTPFWGLSGAAPEQVFPRRLRTWDQELPTLAACHLPDSDMEAVEEGGCGDHEDQDRQPLLVVAPGGLLPDRGLGRVRLVGYSVDGPRGRPGGACPIG